MLFNRHCLLEVRQSCTHDIAVTVCSVHASQLPSPAMMSASQGSPSCFTPLSFHLVCALLSLQVTFKLSQALQQQPVLYSGYIRLVPDSDAPGLYPLVIPYQGYSGNYAVIPVQPQPRKDHSASAGLIKYSRALCYAPGTAMVMPGRYMDSYTTVPEICQGGIAESMNSTISVSLSQLRRFTDCALRITLAIEVPVRR
jgi:hypothetical protein